MNTIKTSNFCGAGCWNFPSMHCGMTKMFTSENFYCLLHCLHLSCCFCWVLSCDEMFENSCTLSDLFVTIIVVYLWNEYPAHCFKSWFINNELWFFWIIFGFRNMRAMRHEICWNTFSVVFSIKTWGLYNKASINSVNIYSIFFSDLVICFIDNLLLNFCETWPYLIFSLIFFLIEKS